MAEIEAYDLDGRSIGTVTLTWDDTGDKRDRMYVNGFPVGKIYAHTGGWTVFDVGWTDANGRPRRNMMVKTSEFQDL